MNTLRLLLASLLACGAAAASQATQPPAPQPPTTAPVAVELPEAWHGKWQGPAQSVRPGGQVTGEYLMGMDIGISAEHSRGALPVYDWRITYTQGQETQTRDYLLRVAGDASGKPLPGHFILDERNGILVDQFLVGQTIQGHFILVSGDRRQILHARYELTSHNGKPAIEVEIATYDGNEARRSTLGEGGVEARRLVRVQRAVLLRQ